MRCVVLRIESRRWQRKKWWSSHRERCRKRKIVPSIFFRSPFYGHGRPLTAISIKVIKEDNVYGSLGANSLMAFVPEGLRCRVGGKMDGGSASGKKFAEARLSIDDLMIETDRNRSRRKCRRSESTQREHRDQTNP
uniref:Uncharacterized protein n=1 Tax=Trichuris muris TaxID=70415 RepID=A0A5S6QH23_TRIMR